MPIGCGSNDTMFPPSPFNLPDFIKNCKSSYGVLPRPHWITTYYGGHVCFLGCFLYHVFIFFQIETSNLVFDIIFTFPLLILICKSNKCRTWNWFSKDLEAISYSPMAWRILIVVAGNWIRHFSFSFFIDSVCLLYWNYYLWLLKLINH